MRIHLYPTFSGVDEGDGGVRRVVEAQKKTLPRLHDQFVDDPGDADVIASHIMIPGEYIKRFPDKPFVAHCHGLYWSEFEWLEWAYKANAGVLRAIQTADAVTAPTEWVAQAIRRHTSRKVHVVPHGVSTREWQPPQDGHRGYVLWNKTRVDPVCTPDDFNVLARVMRDVPFVATFADEGPNVKLTGRLSYEAGKEIVRHAGVYLCTTRETFGIGTLEALSCGVPIVGYRFGGQAEFIEHEKDGWLAEPGDARSLAEGIRWALENRSDISRACRDKALQFPWTAAGKKYHDIYQDVFERYERQESLPRTTIVVAAYNLEKYLPDTLRSVEAQVDQDWECIVVDDASPDSCGVIAEQWAKKDKRFRVIHNPVNLNMTESRNIAIREARGRYILPLDADDQFTPQTVGWLADALDADRTLHCAYGGALFVNEDGRTPTDYGLPNLTPGHSGWPVPFDPVKQVSGYNLLPYSSAFRKTAWEQLGGFRRRLRTAEDADFWTRMASFGFRMEQVTQADTLIYRNREGSKSRMENGHRLDYLRWFPWARDLTLAPAGLLGQKSVGLLDPRVSIIIPVGPGHTKIVQDAVDSCLAQSFPYWECIVVNDSGEDLFLPSWVRVIPCDARDAGAARNLGIAHALASLYLPLDADDFLQPDALQWMMAAHTEAQGAIIYADFFEDPEQEQSYKRFSLPDWNCHDLTRRGTLHAITALTPVTVWRDVGGYSEDGLGWEDWDFQLRCAEAGACSRRLAAPLWTYRKWTGRRRDYDEVEFQRRKKQILARWKDYFEGRKEFVACGCQGGTIRPAVTLTEEAKKAQAQYGDAVLIEYIGGRIGAIRYRGTSGAIYSFGAGETRWVAGADVPLFASRRDFTVHAGIPSDDAEAMIAPVLA